MTSLLKYVGLLNILFFGITIFILARISQNTNLKKHTISHLAGDKKLGKYFNFSLLAFSIVQVIFSIVVIKKVGGSTGSIEKTLFIVGGIFLCLASVFTSIKYPFIHAISAGVCTLLVSIGVILLSFQLFSSNRIIATTALMATLLIPASYLLRNKFTGAFWEFILFSGVFIWNITLTIPLFL